MNDGCVVAAVGASDGPTVGTTVGEALGRFVGPALGAVLGAADGELLGPAQSHQSMLYAGWLIVKIEVT